MILQSRLAKASAVSVCLLCSPAHAFFPFQTDDTGTQGTGGNQIEIDYQFLQEYNDDIDEDGRVIDTNTGSSNSYPLTYTYGVSENIDVFFGIARQTSPVNGWQNTEIGAKWVFAGDQTKDWSVAIAPSVILPVSNNMQDAGLGNAKTNGSVNLIGSYLSEDYELHLNAGYVSNLSAQTEQSEAQRKSIWSISAAPILVINDQWKFGIDVGLSTNPGYNSQYTLTGEVGVSYAPIETLQIGLGLIGSRDISANDNARSYAIVAGITYQF
jgi:hypothetical protein